MTLDVPTINDSEEDYEYLAGACRTVRLTKPVALDFSFVHCRFLKPNAIAVIGAIAHFVQSSGGHVVFKWDTLEASVLRNLESHSFCKEFGREGGEKRRGAIRYRHDEVVNKDTVDSLVQYLGEEWLAPSWPIGLSPLLKSAIVSRVLEIYVNAHEHGHSSVGVVSCGQYFPKTRQLQLSVVDLGVGIPENVRNYRRNAEISGAEALRWAFEEGNSTKSVAYQRGLGLHLLREFVRVNNGWLSIYSGDSAASFRSSESRYTSLRKLFPGTVITITIVCDSSKYRFTFE